MDVKKNVNVYWDCLNSETVSYIIGKHDGRTVWEFRRPGSLSMNGDGEYRLPTEYLSGITGSYPLPLDYPDGLKPISENPFQDTLAIEKDIRDPIYHDKQHWEAEWQKLLRDPAAWERSCGLVAMPIPDNLYPFR